MSIRRKQVTLRPVGADGSALVAQTLVLGPGALEFIAVDYQNQPNTTDFVIKANSTTGATLFTNANGNTDIPTKPVGMPGVDEGAAATAVTDGVAGGLPFTNGLYLSVAQGDGQTSGNEAVVVDLFYRPLKYKRVTLRATSGADGAGATTQTWTRGRPGVVQFLAVDYQNEPVTTDIVIKRDNVNGDTLFTRTSSATDIPLSPVGFPGIDEGTAALAATDGAAGGFPFYSGLYFTLAEADAYTSGNEKVVIDFLYE